MAKEFTGVVGLTIAHSTGSLMVGGTFVVTAVPSTTVKAEGQFVYTGALSFTFSGGTYSGNAGGVGAGTINFTSTKVKVDGSFVLREGDTGTMDGVYTNPAAPPPTLPFTAAPIEISNAGQSKVRSE